jgi:hypothetical protein
MPGFQDSPEVQRVVLSIADSTSIAPGTSGHSL